MATIPTTTIRIDPEVKDQANEVFEELGLSLSAAVNVFLKAVVREGGMPFDMRIAGKENSREGIETLPERERVGADAPSTTTAADGRWS